MQPMAISFTDEIDTTSTCARGQSLSCFVGSGYTQITFARSCYPTESTQVFNTKPLVFKVRPREGYSIVAHLVEQNWHFVEEATGML